MDTCLDQDPEEDDGVGLVFFDDDEEEGNQDEDGDGRVSWMSDSPAKTGEMPV